MKDKIADVLKYIIHAYPYKGELSASRVTKMFYLMDWKSAIEYKKQFTSIKWVFNHYGPYVDDIINIAKKDPEIIIVDEATSMGGSKRIFKLVSDFDENKIVLSKKDKELVDFVIDVSKPRYYQDFINLVYSTYPVIASEKYDKLDLVKLAKEYDSFREEKSGVKS